MTKKVKRPQQAVMKHLENHPEIVYIDGALANLREAKLSRRESQQPA
ncbi:MAG: hypothetical protein M3N42_00770 [Cyanobacteriota bacterium]|nr:hypothetical protein [Cyanobacteriota bacterium]